MSAYACTLDGVYCFGFVEECLPQANPGAVQRYAAAGVDGVGAIPLGARGGTIHLTGVLISLDPTIFATATDLNLNRLYLIGKQDRGPYRFSDTFGNIWPNAYLRAFNVAGKARIDPNRGFFQAYTATIEVVGVFAPL